MGKAPAFQFYPADYLADMQVQMMTLEEEGIYIRLLAYCWREGSIPADSKALSRLCKGASEEAVGNVRELFVEHPVDAGRLTHRRLDEEREKQENWRTKCSKGGKKNKGSNDLVGSKPQVNANYPSDLVASKPEVKGNSSSSSSSSSSEKQEQKPSRRKTASDDGMKHSTDPRHIAFKGAIEAYWNSRNAAQMPWGPMEGKQLGMFLREAPHISLEQFTGFLRARYLSEVNHGERPAQWIKWVTSYGQPVDRFNKPKEARDGQATNGIRSGEGRGSPSRQRVDGARKVLAQIALERGLINPSGANEQPNQEIPIAGSGEQHRGIFQGLRTVGAEILPPESAGGG